MTRDAAARFPPHLVLMGLMGSGKSTVGRLVAADLARPLVDVDDEIRARTGRSVAELWVDGGESAYRPLEAGVVLDTLADDGPDVLALPGGGIDDDRVRAALGAPAVWAVWLRVDPAVLAERVRSSTHRPLVGAEPLPLLRRQAADRSSAFEAAADLVIAVGDRSPRQVADAVLTAGSADGARRPPAP